MRCLFCETEMVTANTEGLFVCPHCDTHVYMNDKKLIPGRKSPKHVVDSFNFLVFVQRTNPDVAMSSDGIFTDGFESHKTLCVYNTRKNTDMYRGRLYPVTSYVSEVAMDFGHVVCFKQVLNYKFSEMMTANLSSIQSECRIPMLTFGMCDVPRYLWQLFVAHNIDYQTRSEFYKTLQKLCATSVLEYAVHLTEKSEQQLAVVAGYYANSRLYSICKNADQTWDDAVTSYYKNAAVEFSRVNASVGDIFSYVDSAMQTALKSCDSGSIKIARDVIQTYHGATLALRDIVDKSVLIDAECAHGADTTVLSILSDKHAGCVLSTELHRYMFYRKLFDTVGLNRPPITNSGDDAYKILKEWSAKMCV